MKYYKKAKEMMDMEVTDFTGGATKEQIDQAMATLAVTFPESYQAFLSDFGAGDIGGEFILGITDIEEENVVLATEMERSVGLPPNFVIINSLEDALCCLDTSDMKNGACPYVKLSENYQVEEVFAESFGKFLYDYVCEVEQEDC